MQLIKWHGGSALIGKDRLQQLATLKDDKKGGVYALCRATDSSANDPKTVLYYTETSDLPPAFVHVRIRQTSAWAVPFFCHTFRASFRRFVSLANRPSKRFDRRTHWAFALPEIGEDDCHCIPVSSPQ